MLWHRLLMIDGPAAFRAEDAGRGEPRKPAAQKAASFADSRLDTSGMAAWR